MSTTLHPIIVLDGPDGSGKTTLSNQLVEQLGAKYLHLTYRWGPKMDLYHTAALFYILREAQKRPVILDRWWMSEVIYANVYRGGSKWPLLYRALEKAALRHSIMYVMCIPSDRDRYVDHFQKLKAERNEMYSDNMEKVYDGYVELNRKLKDQFHPHHGTYDWMTQGEDVVGFAKSLYEHSYDLRMDNYSVGLVPIDHMNLSGSWNYAKYLLVGDSQSWVTRRENFPFARGTTSNWLAQTMETLNVPEHELVHINAIHKDQALTDNNIRKAVAKNLRVVAMGDEALEHLIKLRIAPDYVVKHPREYARFNPIQGLADFKEIMK